MAYGDLTSASSQEATATTTHAVALPTLANNDFLIVSFAVSGSTSDIVTTPTGWTLVRRHAVYLRNMYLFTRRANGGEGATLTITTSASVTSSHCAMAVEKAKLNTEAPDDSDTGGTTMTAGAFAAETSPDPYLVLVAYCNWGGTETITTWPTSFTLGRQDETLASNSSSICATALVDTTGIAKSHTKGGANQWVAGAISLIEDTSTPPVEPQPHAKTLLFPSRCVTASATKLTACTTRLDWCVPEADATPVVTFADATSETLTGNSGSKTYYDKYDFTVDAEVCGQPHSKQVTVTDCGGEGGDYEFVTTGGTDNPSDISPQFCAGESGVWSLSRTLTPVSPTVGDTYAFSYNLNDQCQGGFTEIPEDLGRWKLTSIESHSVLGETWRCETVWDVELNVSPISKELSYTLVSNSETGTRCRTTETGLCPPVLHLNNPWPAGQWNAYGWTQTGPTTRACPTAP